MRRPRKGRSDTAFCGAGVRQKCKSLNHANSGRKMSVSTKVGGSNDAVYEVEGEKSW